MRQPGAHYRCDPGTPNGGKNSQLPRASIKAAHDHAGSLPTLLPSGRIRFLSPPGLGASSLSLIPTESDRKWGMPGKTLEFSCRPKIVPSPQSFQKTRYTRSRNPLNRARILAAPRLKRLCSDSIPLRNHLPKEFDVFSPARCLFRQCPALRFSG